MTHFRKYVYFLLSYCFVINSFLMLVKIFLMREVEYAGEIEVCTVKLTTTRSSNATDN